MLLLVGDEPARRTLGLDREPVVGGLIDAGFGPLPRRDRLGLRGSGFRAHPGTAAGSSRRSRMPRYAFHGPTSASYEPASPRRSVTRGRGRARPMSRGARAASPPRATGAAPCCRGCRRSPVRRPLPGCPPAARRTGRSVRRAARRRRARRGRTGRTGRTPCAVPCSRIRSVRGIQSSSSALIRWPTTSRGRQPSATSGVPVHVSGKPVSSARSTSGERRSRSACRRGSRSYAHRWYACRRRR